MRFLSLILASCLCVVSLASEISTLFEEGNAAYEGQHFEQAILKYSLILEENPSIAEVNFNIANAYYQSNQLGESILYYEKALKLDPGNTDVKHNLQLAYLKSDNAIEPLPKLFFIEWWEQLLASRSASSWAKWAVFFAWLSIALFVLHYYRKNTLFKATGWFVLLICGCMVLFAFQKNKQDNSVEYAIVMVEEVSLKETPNTNAEEVIKAYEGLKVQLVDSVDDWTKVKLDDETEAWIESAKITFI